MSRPAGFKLSDETKAKIRAARLGWKPEPETLARMRAAFARRDYRGEKNPCWRGGIIMSRGRAMQYVGPGKHVPRARLVAAEILGRPLRSDEDAHHKNEIKDDDSRDNIDPLDKREHARRHMANRRRDLKTGRLLCDLSE